MHGAGRRNDGCTACGSTLSQAPGGFCKHWAIHTSQQRPEEDSAAQFPAQETEAVKWGTCP